MRGLFITGTDTGVGKTAVTAALGAILRRRGLDVGVTKPVTTGAARRDGALVSTDAEFLQHVAGVADAPEIVCPLIFETPAAPTVASDRERRPIDLKRLRAAVARMADRHEFLLVEGIGGWRVPIADGFTVRELALELGLPVLVVARAGLGTINHTTLTVESVRATGLALAGVVLVAGVGDSVDAAAPTNAREIERLTGVAVLGTIPFDPTISVEARRAGRIVELVEANVDVDRIVQAMRTGGAQ